ncbi:hypothetical protein [Flavobacterium sp.]
MKKSYSQLINIAIILSLFFAGICFISCEAEKDYTSKNKIIIKRCSLKDVSLKSNFQLRKAVNHFKNLSSTTNSKIVYDENSGLFFDDEKGIYVEKDGKESYSFPVIQLNNEKIKNITFTKNANNGYDIYLVQYDYTKEDINNFSKENLAQRDIKYQTLIRGDVEYPIGEYWYICVTTTTIESVWTEEDAEGTTYVCVTTISTTECTSGGGGSGPGFGGPSPGNGGPVSGPGNPGNGGEGGGGNGEIDPINPTNPTTSHNGNTDDTLLTANILDTESEISNDPCKELKKLFEIDSVQANRLPNLKPQIQELMTNASNNLNYEVAFNFSKNANNEYSTSSIISNPLSQNSAPIKTGGDSYAAGHTHTVMLYPIFSWSDVYTLFSLYKNASLQNKQEVTFILAAKECVTCADVTVLAIKIDNFNNFRAKLNADMNNSRTAGFTIDKQIAYADENFAKKFTPAMNLNQSVKLFLENFNDHNISLYKADENLDNWSKLSLSSNPVAPISETPCN